MNDNNKNILMILSVSIKVYGYKVYIRMSICLYKNVYIRISLIYHYKSY